MKIQDKPALLLIDIQKGFEDLDYWGVNRNNPDAEKKAGILLNFWRMNNMPLFHIKHCSTNPNSPFVEGKAGNEFNDIVKPIAGETIVKKNVSSGFIGTTLKEQLDNAGIKKLVLAGLTTDQCVSTTTRMAGNFGYDTYLVADACATFDKKGISGQTYSAEIIHQTALASLKGEFAQVLNLAELIELFNA